MISALAPTRHTRSVGIMTILAILVVLVAAFRLSTLSTVFAGGGRDLHVQFSDASGISPGDVVKVAGLKVGSVDAVHVQADHALVEVTVRTSVRLGLQTTASLELDTLLGQHSLALVPHGRGDIHNGSTIPLSRTTTPFGVTDALLGSAAELSPINTDQLAKALNTVAGAIDPAAPQVRSAATGLSALAKTVSTRDAQVQELFRQSSQVANTLAVRSQDISDLIRNSGQILQTLDERQQVIKSLLRTTGDLAATITAVINENQAALTPALRHLHRVLTVLKDNQADLDESLRLMAPYLRYFTNLVGNGRWFDGAIAGLVPVDLQGGLPGDANPGGKQ